MSQKTEVEDIIYVTGFGPFPPYGENASQLAVEILPLLGLDARLGITLKTDIIKVQYDDVKKRIPAKWKELKPKVVNYFDKDL